MTKRLDDATFLRLRAANPVPAQTLSDLERTRPPVEAFVGAPTRSTGRTRAPGLSSRSGRRLASVALAGLVGAALLVAPPFGLGERLLNAFDGTAVAPTSLSREQLHVLGAMSTGSEPRLDATDQEDLARVGAAHPRRIAERDGTAYYAADRVGGGLCLSIVHAGDPNPLVGWECSPNFPSPQEPIHDRSVFGGGTIESPVVTRLEGFAADGVAKIRLVTTDGEAVETSVMDNVYLRTDGLPKRPSEKIIALNASGAEIYTHCLIRSCDP